MPGQYVASRSSESESLIELAYCVVRSPSIVMVLGLVAAFIVRC